MARELDMAEQMCITIGWFDCMFMAARQAWPVIAFLVEVSALSRS